MRKNESLMNGKRKRVYNERNTKRRHSKMSDDRTELEKLPAMKEAWIKLARSMPKKDLLAELGIAHDTMQQNDIGNFKGRIAKLIEEAFKKDHYSREQMLEISELNETVTKKHLEIQVLKDLIVKMSIKENEK